MNIKDFKRLFGIHRFEKPEIIELKDCHGSVQGGYTLHDAHIAVRLRQPEQNTIYSDDRNMEVDIEKIRYEYDHADEAGRSMLRSMFPSLSLCDYPKKITAYNRPVTERIRTFRDAIYELGENHPLVVEWYRVGAVSSDLEAYLKLRIICAALNEGWEPKFTEDERRWFPWYYLWTESELDEKSDEWKAEHHLIMIGDKYHSEYAGLASAASNFAPSYSDTDFGSRLCLKSEELATYCGKQFIGIWAAFLLTQKKNV